MILNNLKFKDRKKILCKNHILIQLDQYYLDNNKIKCPNTYALINNKNIIFASIEYEFKISPSNNTL